VLNAASASVPVLAKLAVPEPRRGAGNLPLVFCAP
jgi:hypothetical protein